MCISPATDPEVSLPLTGVGRSSHVVLQSRIKTFQRLQSGTMSVCARKKLKLQNTIPRATMKKYLGNVHWKSKCPTQENGIFN